MVLKQSNKTTNQQFNKMIGHLHPITQFIRQAVKIFEEMEFEVVEGPEIETEYYNFDGLNIPPDHPARDIMDTFYLEKGGLLRTHTSPVQLRTMETRKPPVRIIVPGRVFRHEAVDASHNTFFYQLEGFAIDKNISMANLIATLETFFKKIYPSTGSGQVGPETRIRPGFFPFVEPGIEMDARLKGKWEEVLGAGMIHPQVLKNMGVDHTKWSGFAFGLGVDRLVMLNFGIKDIRLPYSGDLRFLKQF